MSTVKIKLEGLYSPRGSIEVPVLAIMAKNPIRPAEMEEKYKAIAPRIDYQVWAGVSHFLHMEKPREFNQQAALFISRNKLL